MAVLGSSLSAQPRPYFGFDDFQKGFIKNEVLVRVIHFWEARNAKKGDLLMGLELLLIDQKSTVIQAFISSNRIRNYEPPLKADVVYKIKKFLVIDNKSSYRVSSHKFQIQFTQQTTLVQADVSRVLSKIDIERTMFTAWMEKNCESEEARQLTYLEFSTRFIKNNDSKVWSERKQGEIIGRIVNVHSSSGDLVLSKDTNQQIKRTKKF